MMRYMVFFLAVFGAVILSGAQDRFYLKNGSIIKGKYIHSASSDSALCVSVEGGDIYIPQGSLAYAKFKRHYGVDEENSKGFGTKISPPGYYTVVSIGGNIGSQYQYYTNITPSIESVVGYRWNRFMNVAGGISADLYESYMAVPVFVHYELDPGYQSLRPFLYGNAGYGHVWTRSSSSDLYKIMGGLYLAGGMGYKIRTGNHDVRMSIGLKSQQARLKLKDQDLVGWATFFTSRRQIMNRVTAKVGITF